MYNTKKESRPAATESAILVKEVFGNPRKDYTTQKRRKQVVFTTFFVMVVLTAWVVSGFTKTKELVPVEHKVTYGDTLWNIAKQYKPDDMTMDAYMSWVYKHNEGGTIYPGDTVIMAEVIE